MKNEFVKQILKPSIVFMGRIIQIDTRTSIQMEVIGFSNELGINGKKILSIGVSQDLDTLNTIVTYEVENLPWRTNEKTA